jgi:hypothetical protein
MYDAIEERMAAYEKEIQRKLGELESEQHQGQAAPPLQKRTRPSCSRIADKSLCGRLCTG